MKKYTVVQGFSHNRADYVTGQPCEFSEVTGEALKRAGLLMDYSPPNFPAPGCESSASLPGRVSRKRTSKQSASIEPPGSAA